MIKKLIILLIVIASMAEQSKGQTNKYHPFPDSNALWCDSSNMHGCYNESYAIAGDTIVSGKTYHKLTKNIVSCAIGVSGICECSMYSVFHTYYAGAIRQDTAQRKVYLLLPTKITDTLFYDFSLHIGDTLKTYYTSPVTYPPPVIVSAIDSILIGTSYRKRWTISPASYTTIVINKQIEGIGSTSGLFNWMMESNTSGQPVAYLTCFSKNNQTFYPYYSISTSCQQVTTGIQQYANSNEVSIYPNPASSSLQVTSSGNIQNTTLQITDMLGNTVKQSIIYNPTSIISVADLSEGIYNISISSNEGVVNKRVVIVR